MLALIFVQVTSPNGVKSKPCSLKMLSFVHKRPCSRTRSFFVCHSLSAPGCQRESLNCLSRCHFVQLFMGIPLKHSEYFILVSLNLQLSSLLRSCGMTVSVTGASWLYCLPPHGFFMPMTVQYHGDHVVQLKLWCVLFLCRVEPGNFSVPGLSLLSG